MKLLYRSQPLVAIALMSLLATTEVHAHVKYNFTEIANTNGNLKTLGISAINNVGVVGFNAQLDDGKEGVFSSDGKTTTTIVNPTSNFSYIESASINDAGTMAFIASQNSQNPKTVGVYTSNGINLKAIRTSTTTDQNGGPIPPNAYFRAVSINNSGIVAFSQMQRRGEFVFTSDGSTIKQIAVTGGSISSIQINDFNAVVYTNLYVGVYVVDGNTTTTVDKQPGESNFFTNASINNNGSVAYVKEPADRGNSSTIKRQVLLKKGDTIATIADSDGDFSRFGSTSINDRGTVAFSANLDAGGEGIFIGKNSKTDKVIATGDSLFGYTVVDLDFASEGLNNSGQITFVAKLANNSQVVVRANPRRGYRG